MEKTLKQLIAEMDRIEQLNEFDPKAAPPDPSMGINVGDIVKDPSPDVEKGIDDFYDGPIKDKLGFSPTGELLKMIYRTIKKMMPNSNDAEVKAAAQAVYKDIASSTIKK